MEDPFLDDSDDDVPYIPPKPQVTCECTNWVTKPDVSKHLNLLACPYTQTRLAINAMAQEPERLVGNIRCIQRASMGTGGSLWACGVMLCAFMQKLNLAGKTIIELGCGTGSASVAAGTCGAARVIATDKGKLVSLIQENIDANTHIGRGTSTVLAREHSWGESVVGMLEELGGLPDLLLLADVAYFTELHPVLFASLTALTGPSTLVVWCHKQRLEETEIDFMNRVHQQFFVLSISHSTISQFMAIDSLPLDAQNPFIELRFLVRKPVHGVESEQKGDESVTPSLSQLQELAVEGDVAKLVQFGLGFQLPL
eukprot:TRINITY_DN2003_c0_g3_i5.p1 TRINITY_DN2003_c0_g3~~TRINITY_DN2003_c0_g3_i5.p1  ORF type:complete len:312 (+),score=49.46 TRINITY_DN2003_c0_g3_i5:79-1014(+)